MKVRANWDRRLRNGNVADTIRKRAVKAVRNSVKVHDLGAADTAQVLAVGAKAVEFAERYKLADRGLSPGTPRYRALYDAPITDDLLLRIMLKIEREILGLRLLDDEELRRAGLDLAQRWRKMNRRLLGLHVHGLRHRGERGWRLVGFEPDPLTPPDRAKHTVRSALDRETAWSTDPYRVMDEELGID